LHGLLDLLLQVVGDLCSERELSPQLLNSKDSKQMLERLLTERVHLIDTLPKTVLSASIRPSIGIDVASAHLSEELIPPLPLWKHCME
jgi:hypothetical protein